MPIPRRPSLDLLRVPGRLRAAVPRSGDVLRADRGRRAGRLRRLRVRRRPTSRPGACASPRRARGERPGRPGQPARRAAHAVRRDEPFPGALPHGRYVGLPLRRASRTWTARRRRAEARRAFGLDADRPTLLVTGGSQGARRLNEAAAGAVRPCAPPASRCCTRPDRRNIVDASTASRRPAVRRGALPRADGARLRRRRPDAVPGRGEHVCRAGRGRAARRSTCRCRSATASSELNARPVVDAGGGLLVDDADCTPDWVAATRDPAAAGPERLDAMGARRRSVRPAGRRRAAGRPGRSRPPPRVGGDRERAVARHLPADLGRVHFIGIGGAGMSGIARIMLARGLPVSGSDAKDSSSSPRCARWAPTVARRPRRGERRRRDTVVVSTAIRSTTPSWSRPGGAGCGCCTGPRRWPR